MVHNLIAAAILGLLAALWWYSGVVGRLNRGDQALLARNDAEPAERERRCPQCRGLHCDHWLQLGAPCPPQHAPKLTDTLLGPGLHEPTAAYRRIVPAGWRPPRPAWQTLYERIGALPRVGVLP